MSKENRQIKRLEWFVVNHCKASLEKEIEKVRAELYKGSNSCDKIQDMDAKTYALSLKMDKLIAKYMKSREN